MSKNLKYIKISIILFSILMVFLYFYNIFKGDEISLLAADKDFANYWAASKLIESGDVGKIFGPQNLYHEYLVNLFKKEVPQRGWSYPPTYLLLMVPLSIMDYKLSMISFLFITASFFLISTRFFLGRLSMQDVVFLLPFLTLNTWAAQNGFLTGGFIIFALSMRDKRPVISGVMLGFLVIKPQLAILFPFLLIMERNFVMIISTILTMSILIFISIAVFGIDSWVGFINETVPFMKFVMERWVGLFLAMMPSLFGYIRLIGYDFSVAMTVHLIFAGPAFLLTCYLLWIDREFWRRSVVLIVATFCLVPYSLAYDLGILSAAAILCLNQCEQSEQRLRLFLICVACLPLTVAIQLLMIPVLQIFLFGMFGFLAIRIISQRNSAQSTQRSAIGSMARRAS